MLSQVARGYEQFGNALLETVYLTNYLSSWHMLCPEAGQEPSAPLKYSMNLMSSYIRAIKITLSINHAEIGNCQLFRLYQ